MSLSFYSLFGDGVAATVVSEPTSAHFRLAGGPSQQPRSSASCPFTTKRIMEHWCKSKVKVGKAGMLSTESEEESSF